MTLQVGGQFWTQAPGVSCHEPKPYAVTIVAVDTFNVMFDLHTGEDWGTLHGHARQLTCHRLYRSKEELLTALRTEALQDDQRTMRQLLQKHGRLLEAWRRGDYDG